AATSLSPPTALPESSSRTIPDGIPAPKGRCPTTSRRRFSSTASSSRLCTAQPVVAVHGSMRLVLRREGARQLAQRLLMLLVRDLREVARELQAHPLARADRAAALGIEPLEEIGDRHAQHARDLEEAAGRDAVDATLVFMRLLVGDADQVGKLLLGQAEHDAALADPGADMTVDVLGTARRSFHLVRSLVACLTGFDAGRERPPSVSVAAIFREASTAFRRIPSGNT